MKQPIYLDYAATTPVDPKVAEQMMNCLTMEGVFGNPASRSHRFGWQAEELVDIARHQVADLLNADAREIIWTSGATEANNLVIKGFVEGHKQGHIITSAFEHKAVLDCCQYLENKGFKVTYILPDRYGHIAPKKIAQAITSETLLISIMHVNNEIGTIQDIEAIAEIASTHKIAFHVDAAQSVGKISIDLSKLKIDYLSFSAHKIYGPKGIGGLFARKNQQQKLTAQIHGGGHERGLRSGTLATHQIVGIGAAFELANQELMSNSEDILSLKKQFTAQISQLEGVQVNGELKNSIAGIVNLSFDNVDSETLIMAFKDIAVSSGSACTSASVEPSYVLKSLGLTDQQAHSSLRFSFGRFTTKEQIDKAISIIKRGLQRLRTL